MDDTQQMRWIDAAMALNRLSDVYGNRKQVKAWLADALRDDRLKACAAETWISSSPKLSFKPPTDAAIERDVIVPARYWRANSRSWAEDQERWRWPYNQAVVTITRKPPKRRLFRGLKFLQADVDRLAKVPGPSPSGEPRGPKTRAADWGFVAAKLCTLYEHGEFHGNLPSANELATRLKVLTSERFGETALWEFSNAFLKSYSAK